MWLFVVIPLAILVAVGVANFITLVLFGTMLYCAVNLAIIKKRGQKSWVDILDERT